jgi:hypothetical protein
MPSLKASLPSLAGALTSALSFTSTLRPARRLMRVVWSGAVDRTPQGIVRGCAGTDGPPGRLSGVGEVPSGPRNEDMGARNGPQGTQATPQPITSASGRASYRKTHKDAGCGELRARCLNARPDIQDHVHLFTMSEYLCGQTPRSLLFFAPLVLTSNAQPLRCFRPITHQRQGPPYPL